ncbi:MAG TPA: ACT domain-containing protein [Ornithinimicrobium sp.]|uniref:ACT domain-containing protein n=1 Tax=Ornithinimicrobium sp. TaxID=1977084 RepID=UPI002B49D518|nr:ACT domain-containing protein [Ornithinimicrobium sp.]HKJ11446.1 ACT domain-containing protein [Ornithinimicrobium sp.]
MSPRGRGERDLATLLRTLQPRLEEGEWVFVTVDGLPTGIAALATFQESEGLSAVVRREDADAQGLSYELVTAWISLTVHSALDAVGLTAAMSTRLADAGISANVVAARHHDHLFVPFSRAEEALRLVRGLREE